MLREFIPSMEQSGGHVLLSNGGFHLLIPPNAFQNKKLSFAPEMKDVLVLSQVFIIEVIQDATHSSVSKDLFPHLCFTS